MPYQLVSYFLIPFKQGTERFMRGRYIFFILLCYTTLLPKAAVSDPHRLTYTIAVEPKDELLAIQGRLEGVSEGMVGFFLPRLQGFPVTDIIKNLVFESNGRYVTPTFSEDGQWYVDVEDGEITFTYGLSLDFAKSYGSLPWGGSLSSLDERSAFINGSMSFIVPANVVASTKIALEWKVPPGWMPISPWTTGDQYTPVPSIYGLVHNYYQVHTGGSIVRRRIRNLELTMVWLGKDDIRDYPEAMAQTAKVIHAAIDFFGGSSTNNRLTLFLRDTNPRNLYRASTESSTIEFNFKRGISFGALWQQFRNQYLELLAHEFFHTWEVRDESKAQAYLHIAEWGENTCWIREGFTEYFSSLVLLEAGFLTQSDFLNLMQQKALQASKVNNRNELALASSCKNMFNEQDALQYVYFEGAATAFALDLELRTLTNGVKTLPEFMQGFLSRYQYEEKSVEALISTWEEYAPNRSSDIRQLVKRKQATNLAPALSALGVRSRHDPRTGRDYWEVPEQSNFAWYFD